MTQTKCVYLGIENIKNAKPIKITILTNTTIDIQKTETHGTCPYCRKTIRL